MGCCQRLFYADGGDAAGEEGELTIWQGAVAQRYVTGVVAGLACRRITAGRCVITCVLSRRMAVRAAAELSYLPAAGYPDESATLLNENGVTEWTPLFYEAIRRGSSVSSTGSRTWRFCPAVGGGGSFLL